MSFPFQLHACWRWVHGLALDVVAVAVAWFYGFGQMTGARLQPGEAGCLATAVWLIYLGDRMLDAAVGTGTGERHRFAARHRSWLLPVMTAAAAAALWWALQFMRWSTLRTALGVGFGAGLYAVIVLASRWKAVSPFLLVVVSGWFVMALVQREELAPLEVQWWRVVLAGSLATVLYVGLRHQLDPAPWILTKKWLGGYLFALGVAVAPFSHLEDWPGLLHGTPVLLFASACALNSLGIRLWENVDSTDAELTMLRRLYPWLLVAVGGGAMAEAGAADDGTRLVLRGVGGSVAGLALIHVATRRWPAAARTAAADGVMLAAALLVLWAGRRGLA